MNFLLVGVDLYHYCYVPHHTRYRPHKLYFLLNSVTITIFTIFIKLCLAVERYTSSWFLYTQYKEKMREISDPSNYFAYLFFTCNFSSIIFETLK